MDKVGPVSVARKRIWIAVAAIILSWPVYAADHILVAKQGRTSYQIVVPTDRNTAVEYAAAELQKFLKQSTGVGLPIVNENHAGDGPAIFIGPSKKAAEIGLLDKTRTLGEDGVLIKTVGGDLFLLGGGDRGLLYSVYIFLERYLGFRFLARDCTIAPRRSTLRIPPIDYSYSPPFIYREMLGHDASYGDFAARQKLNGGNMSQVLPRTGEAQKDVLRGVLFYPFVHSAAYFIPPEKYFADHPEYFGLVNGKRIGETISGQLCYSNPDVLKITIDETLKLIQEHPEITSVDISQNDSWPDRSGACECEKCSAIVKEEGAQHGPILRFVNAVADAVAAKYPGRTVDTLAYSYALATPKVTKPRDNVIIRLCHFACYFHGIEGEELGGEFRQAVVDWRTVAKNVFIWHYGVNFWSYMAPNPNLTALAKDLKYYHKQGINGVMLQGDIQSGGGELAELRQYLASQLMWDPTLDPMSIREDFCKGYYGPAAKEALAFLALMDDFGKNTKFHIPMNGWKPEEVTPPDFVARGLAILNKAYKKAGDDVIRNRVDKLLLPLWYMQLSWPDRYGLSNAEGRALTARVKGVMEKNAIDTISEGPPNAADFIRRMEAATMARESPNNRKEPSG